MTEEKGRLRACKEEHDMNKAWKSLSLLLSFILILGCILAHPMQAKAEGELSFDRGDVQVNIKNQQNGTVYYKVDGGEWTEITNNPFTLRTSHELNGVTSGTVYLKAVPNNEQSLDTHDKQNRINSGEGDVQIPLEELKSEAGYSFEYVSTKTYSVQIAFEQGGTNPSGPQDPPSGQEEDVNLTVNWSGSFGEIKVGGKSVDLNNTSQSFSRLPVNDNGMIDVSIQAEITIQFSSIKINGTEQLSSGEKKEFYAFQIPKTDTGLSIDVVTAQSDTYTIQWAYDDSFGEDALVEHGNIEMISGYTSGGDTYWLAEKGAVVRVKLVPDYGYQVVGAKINGEVDLVAENESNEFTFEMPPTHVHFKGIFKKTEDIVANSSAAVSGASFSGSAVASTGGTAKMTISEATPSDTDNVTGTIDTTKSVQAVDIRMDQLFYKNSADAVWSTNKTELSSAAEVSLTVNQSAGGYAVLREHNGVVEEIAANYNSSTNTITFSSNKYSTYTLVPLKGQETTVIQQEETSKNEDSKKEDSTVEETLSYTSQPIGDVVGGTSITSWNDLDKALDAKKISITKTTPAGTAAVTNSQKTELVQLKLRNNNTTVPASTFANLSNTNYSGLHLFTGNGTAVTFVNDAKLAGQKAINVGCSTVSLNGRKIMTFKSTNKLSSTVVLHATVPAGTKTVSVYFTGADNKRALLTTVAPTAAGRLCFAINQLGKYELVYN